MIFDRRRSSRSRAPRRFLHSLPGSSARSPTDAPGPRDARLPARRGADLLTPPWRSGCSCSCGSGSRSSSRTSRGPEY